MYLLGECRSTRSGQVYEIGTTARVIGARNELLTLETGDPAHRDVLVCVPDRVSHERAPRPRQTTPWYRRRAAGGLTGQDARTTARRSLAAALAPSRNETPTATAPAAR